MKDEKKIPASILYRRLQRLMNYENPRFAAEELVRGWANHPKTKGVTYDSLRVRIRRDGFLWLREDEIMDFENYIGYPLM